MTKDMRLSKKCERCGKEFKVSPSHARRKYCGLYCSNHGIRKNTGRTLFKKGEHYNQGEKSHFWKGGLTSLYNQIRNLNENKIWRSQVFERDNYACQECGDRTKIGHKIYLEAHHIKPFSKILHENNIKSIQEAIKCKELWDINNGTTLCFDCHNKTKYLQIMKGGKSEMIKIL